jgi:serine/threonine-protein kinase
VTPPAPPVYRPPTPYYDYEEPPRRRSFWPWLIGLGAAVILGIAGFLLYQKLQDQLNRNAPVAVPDVRLIQESLAEQQLRDVGLEVKVKHRASMTVTPGNVVEQNPDPGNKIGKGSTVTIYVSNGKPRTTVPDVVNHQYADAVSAIADAGLSAKIVFIYSSQPENTVTAQVPAAGDRVLKGSKVRINVSRGAKPVQVPDVVGQPYANAAGALKGAGFGVTRVDIESDQPKGQVVAEDPVAGTPVPEGSKVTLSVSKGPTTSQVPDVTGQNAIDARALLQGAGFKVAIVQQEVTDPSQDGVVLDESPVGGTPLKPGAVVTITVGKLSAGTTTPTTTGTTTAPGPGQ